MKVLEVGDHVETPYGEAVVHSVDLRTMRFVTEDCETGVLMTWDAMEVEQLEPAPPEKVKGEDDGERLEAWLRCTARIVPRLQVSDELVRCETGIGCECKYCYSIERVVARRGDPTQRMSFTHMIDNVDLCHCLSTGCGCVPF